MPGGRGEPDLGGIAEIRQFVSEHENRIENLLLRGKIEEIDYKAGRARVRVGDPEGDSILTDWLRWQHPRARDTRAWEPPEVDEQVMILCPSGLMQQGVIVYGFEYEDFPFVCDDPEIKRWVYGAGVKVAEDLFKVCFEDFRRNTGHWWSYLFTDGRFRFEVGEDTNIIADKEHIQLRVKDTQLVIKDGSIKLHVKGKQVELLLDEESALLQVHDKVATEWKPDSITANVEQNAVLRMEKDAVSAELVDKQVRALLHDKGFKAMVEQAVYELLANKADVRVPGSSITLEQSGITMLTPQFNGNQGSAQGHPYETGGPEEIPDEPPHVTVPRPEIKLGGPPYYPDKAE